MTSRPGGARRPDAERRLVLLTGLAACIPIVLSTVEVVLAGWTPLADDAMLAVSAYEVPTADSPLLGAWSSGFTDATGRDTFHPGPLLFWLLALPSRAFAPGSLEVAAALLNVASVLCIVALAHRRGGRPLMFGAALAVAVMMASLPAEAYSDIWNPYVALLPFLALIFLCWSLACGELRLLPLAVAAGSFAAQGHLSFLVPVLAVAAVGLAGLALSRRREPAEERMSARPWVLAAVGVLLLCWIGPLVDQAANRPGNGVLIGRAILADDPTLGFDQGWRALVHTVGIVPWWLESPSVGLDRVIDLTIRPGWLAIGSAAAIVAALAALAVVGFRRDRLDVAAAAALGLVLCAAAAMVTMSTPEKSFATLVYTLRWTSPAGMFAWLALVWSAASLLAGSGAAVRSAERPARRPGAVAVAGVVVVAAAGTVVGIGGELKQEPYDEMDTLANRTKAAVAPDRVVRVEVASSPDGSFLALGLGAGLVYKLRTDGTPVTAPAFSNFLGSEYNRGGRGADEQVVRVDVDRPPPAGGRRLARMRVEDPADPGDALAPKPTPVRTVTLTLDPSGGSAPGGPQLGEDGGPAG